MSEPYTPDNLLDRRSDPGTLQVHYDQEHRREQELLSRRLGLDGGRRAVGRLRLASRAGTCSRRPPGG